METELSTTVTAAAGEHTGTGLWFASFGEGGLSRPAEFEPKFSRLVAATPERARALRLFAESAHPFPVWAESSSCAVVFDGVLHNRTELRAYLEDSILPGANDAELIAHAYLRWGEEVVHKLKGIFAIILWDRQRGTLLAVRDPIGIYPLFYADTGRELLFSTTIQALLRHPRVPRPLNRPALAERLCDRWWNVEETYYASVRRVPPGNAMFVTADSKRVWRYWDPAPPGVAVEWIREDELHRFDDLMEQAVARCLDIGPAGIYLSGGLDSISVAAVATDIAHRKGLPLPWALSLGFADPEINEESVQRGVAHALGIPLVLMPFDKAMGSKGSLDAAMDLTRTWPQPMLHLWLTPYQRLGMEGTSRGCTVLLTGGGGDEWLGVTPILAADLVRNLEFKRLYRLWDSTKRSYKIPSLKFLRRMLWGFGLEPLLASKAKRTWLRLAPGLFYRYRRRRIAKSIPDWISSDTCLRRELAERSFQAAEAETERVSQAGSFYILEMRRALDHPLVVMEMEELFEHGRRMGVRILQPYWDADLITLLYRTPPDLLNRGGRSKGLVREMLAKRFPALAFDQQKKVLHTNFYRPIIIQEAKTAWKDMNAPLALAQLDIVKDGGLKSAIAAGLLDNTGKRNYWSWQVLNVETWLQSHI